MKVKTSVLQEMVSKAIKASSLNKLIPITSFINIRVTSDGLQLVTTDVANYLYVTTDEGYEPDEGFYITVGVEQFSKLIQKLTSEFVNLTITDNGLVVESGASGKYVINIPLDEDGKIVQFPDPVKDYNLEDMTSMEVSKADIDLVTSTCKSALATTYEVPVYVNYMLGENVIATDTYKIASVGKQLLDVKCLISSELMDLVSLINEEKFRVFVVDNKLIAVGKDVTVYGNVETNTSDYASDAITELIQAPLPYSCSVSKAELLSVLDRVSLFVGVYDNKAISLTFAEDGLRIASKKSNGTEVLSYKDTRDHEAFTCMIDVEMITSQVKSIVSDVINIEYGQPNAIKFVDGNVTQVIALLQDN